MKRYSVNLTTIFTEVPFLERFQKAREAGFDFVECQSPYDYSIFELKEALENAHLSLELINLPPGDWGAGDRGLAVDPNRMEEFRESVETGIHYAKALQVDKIHCMAGIVQGSLVEAKKTYLNNVTYAAGKLAQHGLTLLIEPINHYDIPGYFLANLHEANALIDEMGCPNIKLQYDFYHIQRTHGNLIANFDQYLERIGHIQIADAPGRNQPGTGEIHYENIIKHIELSSYNGLIGLEYTPSENSEDSFTWISRMKERSNMI